MTDKLVGASELVRALTPCLFGLTGLTIILCAVLNSEKLSGDRFAYTVGSGVAFLTSGAGGFSPQNRPQAQTRVNHADQIDIDQSK